MQTKPTRPTGSPVPGVIPEPVHVEVDVAPPDGRRPPRRPRRTLLGRLLSALRGDKYMADAYAPRWHDPIVVHDHRHHDTPTEER